MSCRSRQPSAALKKALDLYNQNKLEQALPLLRQVARDENDVEARAWLAETYRRLGKKDSAVIAARSALGLDPSSGFAHTVIADACNPMYGEWAGANADTQLDSLADLQDERGNLTTISDQIVIGWMHKQAAGTFRQPIAMSVTVDPDFIPGIKEHLRQSGAFNLWQPEHSKAIPDTAALRACLASVSTDDFTGPFVGARDRSPIRRTYTNGLVMNVTATALTYSQMLIKSGSSADALRWLDWAEAFERKTEHGPVFSEQIAELRQSAKQDNK